jgi:hypothetical protein
LVAVTAWQWWPPKGWGTKIFDFKVGVLMPLRVSKQKPLPMVESEVDDRDRDDPKSSSSANSDTRPIESLYYAQTGQQNRFRQNDDL